MAKGGTLTTQTWLTRHQNAEHGNRERNEPKQDSVIENGCACPACNKLYKNKKALASHYRQAHGATAVERQAAGGELKCDKCDKTFKNQAWLTRHQNAEHGDGEENETKCNICDTNFEDQKKLNTHMREAHSEDGAGRTCAECGKAFSSRSGLIRHLNHIHNQQQQ